MWQQIKKLTVRHELFCREYIIDYNAARAARAAGYSDKSANTTGYRLIREELIKTRINQLIGESMERLEISADYVLRRLYEIDNLDVADILDDSGEVKPISEWPEGWRKSVTGLDYDNSAEGASPRMRRIKWPDKVKNLELLGKHTQVRAFVETIENINGEKYDGQSLDDFYREHSNPESSIERVLENKKQV